MIKANKIDPLNTFPLYHKSLSLYRRCLKVRRKNILPGEFKKFSGKELDAETGLYYYGARYLDAKAGRWLSADPALGDYIPGAPVDDAAKKRNSSLPGMGGVFNIINLHLYHYAGNNPVKYTDPDGEADVKPNMLMGIKVHRAFYNAVEDVLNPGEGIILYDTGIGSILRDAAELLHQEPGLDSLAHPLKRPDITILSINGTDIYELKPVSSEKGYKHTLAEKQLSGYINTFFNKLLGGVEGGSAVPDNLEVPFPEAGEKAKIIFTSDKEVKGLYYYRIDDGWRINYEDRFSIGDRKIIFSSVKKLAIQF
jgi:RHS repeat-associated protein